MFRFGEESKGGVGVHGGESASVIAQNAVYTVTCDKRGRMVARHAETAEERVLQETYPDAQGQANAAARPEETSVKEAFFVGDARLVVLLVSSMHGQEYLSCVLSFDLSTGSRNLFGLSYSNFYLRMQEHYLLFTTCPASSHGLGHQLLVLDCGGAEIQPLCFDSIQREEIAQVSAELEPETGRRLKFAQLPNGQVASLDAAEGRVVLWDVATQAEVSRIEVPLPEGYGLPSAGARAGGAFFGGASIPAAAVPAAASSASAAAPPPKPPAWYRTGDWEVVVVAGGDHYRVDLQAATCEEATAESLENHRPYLCDQVGINHLPGSLQSVVDLGDGWFATIPAAGRSYSDISMVHVWDIHRRTRADLELGAGVAVSELRKEGDTLLVDGVRWSISEQRCLEVSADHWQRQLFTAAFRNDPVRAKEALDNGAQINSPDSYGSMAVRIAIFEQNAAVVEYLLSRGADPARSTRPEQLSAVKLAELGYFAPSAGGRGPDPRKQKQALEILRMLGEDGNRRAETLGSLLPAISAGDLDGVRQSLDNEAEVDYIENYNHPCGPYGSGRSLLHFAIGSLDKPDIEAIITLLIERGALVGAPTPHVPAPVEVLMDMTVAPHHQRVSGDGGMDWPKVGRIIRLLAGPEAEQKHLFLRALVEQDAVAAESALKAGADVSQALPKVCHQRGQTALAYTVNSQWQDADQQVAMVRVLRAAGADMAGSQQGEALLATVKRQVRWAQEANIYSKLELLRIFSPEEAKQYDLIAAVRRSDVEAVRELLAQDGCDVNFTDSEGGNAFLLATGSWNAELVEPFLQHGVDEGLKSQALAGAKARADAAVIELLCPAEEFQRTQLLPAAQAGDCDGIRVALDAGAEIDLSREEQQRLANPGMLMSGRAFEQRTTALCLACSQGHLDAARLLVERGASQEVVGQGGTPLQLASRNYHVEIVRLLAGDETANNIELIRAARHRGHGAVEAALAAGADVNYSEALAEGMLSDELNSALYWACRNNDARMIELLQGRGAVFGAGAPGYARLLEDVEDHLQTFERVDLAVLRVFYDEQTVRNYQLLQGARLVDVEQVREALLAGADPNYHNPGAGDIDCFGGRTALQECEERSWDESVATQLAEIRALLADPPAMPPAPPADGAGAGEEAGAAGEDDADADELAAGIGGMRL